jgi:hypothetical protein
MSGRAGRPSPDCGITVLALAVLIATAATGAVKLRRRGAA